MSELTELGKLKQSINNKIDRDFFNNNKEAFDREISESETLKNTQSHFTEINKSEINAKTGYIYYDQINDVLEIKKNDGEWREVGGSTSELKGKIDVIRCKETVITDTSIPLEIYLDESYPASEDNLQVFIDGRIIESGKINISSNGLKLTIDKDVLIQDGKVKVQYFNYVPRSAIRAGIQMLGQICDTYVSGSLESGAVFADGFVYERTINGDFKYRIEDSEEESKWVNTEDFSEELYTRLRFANRNEIDESTNPEYETLLNDDRLSYIDAISFEHWALDENKIFFALDPSRHRYIVPEINSDTPSLKKYVVVKSIYNDILGVGKSILSVDKTIRENIQKLNTYLDSSSNKIVENVPTTQIKEVNGNFFLLGTTKIFYPNGKFGENNEYSSTIISNKSTAYLTLDVNTIPDGEYYILLNKIGEDSTRYKVEYISPQEFYISDYESSKLNGAYLYKDNSKIEIYENGIADDNYYSMPVCRVTVENNKIKDIDTSNNIYLINNGVLFGAGISINVPIGINNSSRINSIYCIDHPDFVEIDENTKTVYAELNNNDNIIVKKSDEYLEYNFNTNTSKLGSEVIKAAQLLHLENKVIFYPKYDKFYVQEKISFDKSPIKNSENLLTSGAIYEEVASKADVFLENTGFISNGIIEIPEEGVGYSSDNIYTLNAGVEFLIADGLQKK